MKNFTLMSVLSVLFISTSFAQDSDAKRVERQRIKGTINQFLGRVVTKIDTLNPDEYADAFRCPYDKANDQLGHLVNRDDAKKIIAGIHVVAAEEGWKILGAQSVDFTVKPAADRETNEIEEHMVVKREAYLQLEKDKNQTQVVALLMLQAVCRGYLEEQLSQTYVSHLMGYLQLNVE